MKVATCYPVGSESKVGQGRWEAGAHPQVYKTYQRKKRKKRKK